MAAVGLVVGTKSAELVRNVVALAVNTIESEPPMAVCVPSAGRMDSISVWSAPGVFHWNAFLLLSEAALLNVVSFP